MAERVAGAVLATGTAVVAGLLWWGADAQVAGDPGNAATVLAPPDGHRAFAGPGDGVAGVGAVTEHARLTGAETVLTTPSAVGDVLGVTLDGDPFGWRIWRSTTTPYGSDEVQTTTLRRLTDEGVEQVAAFGPVALVFDPPLLEVPADVRDGSTWSPAGDVVVDGQVAGVVYEGDFEADDDGDGCLRITGSLDIRRDDQSLLETPSDERWCPGRGTVPDEPLGEIPALDGSTEPLDLLTGPADVEDWVEHDRPLQRAEGEPAAPQLWIPPVPGAEGRVVLADANGDDVVAFDLRPGGTRLRAWTGHPGGDVLRVTAAGDLVVAATSGREVVAYGPDGAWRWRTRLDDVASAPALAADARRLLVATVSGQVVALDPTDGSRVWSARVDDEVRLAPVADGRTVVVADETGALTAYDLNDGTQRWSADTTGTEALGLAGDVLVARTLDAVQAFDLDDGERLWSRRSPYAGAGDLVADLGGVVAVASAEGTLGLEPATGRERWRAEGAPQSLARAGHLFLLEERRLAVLDADGRRVRGWTLSGLQDTATFLTPTTDGVLVTDGTGASVEVSP